MPFVFRSCARRSGRSGATSGAFRAAFPKRRTPERSGLAAESRLPISVFGVETEKPGSGQRVLQFDSPKRQTAVRSDPAGRSIAVPFPHPPSLRGVCPFQILGYGFVRLQKGFIDESQFFG